MGLANPTSRKKNGNTSRWAREMRMATPNLRAMFIFAAAIASSGSVSIRAGPWRDTLLPAGFLSTRGSQIIGINGVPVRIASVGLTGMNVVGGRLQLEGPFKGFTEDIAPVWVGEMGASMISSGSQAWGQTLLDYMNGKALAGPKFSGSQQPIGGDWWAWGCLEGENPDGCLGKDGMVRPEQACFIRQMLFHPIPRL